MVFCNTQLQLKSHARLSALFPDSVASLNHKSCMLFLFCWICFCACERGRQVDTVICLVSKVLLLLLSEKHYLVIDKTCSDSSWRRLRDERAAALCVFSTFIGSESISNSENEDFQGNLEHVRTRVSNKYSVDFAFNKKLSHVLINALKIILCHPQWF